MGAGACGCLESASGQRNLPLSQKNPKFNLKMGDFRTFQGIRRLGIKDLTFIAVRG